MDLARYRAARDVLDHLDVSIDSHVPATYEAIRVGARFEQVRDHVYAVRDERKRRPDDVLLTVSAVVMRSNLDHLPGLIAFAAEAGASGVILKGLNRATPTAEGEDPYAAFGAERVALALAACRRAALEHGINLLRLTGCAEADGAVSVFPRPSRLPLGPTSRLDGLCWYLGQNFHVLHTGEVYPCLMPTTHVAGDVYRDDPIAVWNGPVLTALRAAHYARRQTPFCSGCVHAPHLPAADAETRSVEEASRAARRAAYPV